MSEAVALPASPARRAMTLLALIMAGEAVFFLPFVLVRVFRPTLLEVFAVTNLELGVAFSAYGIVAMVSYALGGPIADRFPERGLLSLALVTTAAGGLVMAAVPSLGVLTVLYGFWGLTTILLFWAALIRATRVWGGEGRLGTAYGLLDGGRGLFAAAIGAVSVALLGLLMPDAGPEITMAERRFALRQVILLFSGATLLVGGLVWLVLPAGRTGQAEAREKFSLAGVRAVAALPQVWLQALIILCAYVGYKAIDDVSLYAYEVLMLDEVEAAGMAATTLWMRPLAAVAIGVLADRTGTSLMTLLSFSAMLLGALVLGAGGIGQGGAALFLLAVAATSAGIYALRGLYFAIMGRGKIPIAFTGTAVGIVSTIGYTPDIFMGPLMGWILDSDPGPPGHFTFFRMVSGFAAVGLLAAATFAWVTRARRD